MHVSEFLMGVTTLTSVAVQVNTARPRPSGACLVYNYICNNRHGFVPHLYIMYTVRNIYTCSTHSTFNGRRGSPQEVHSMIGEGEFVCMDACH